jgi:hypothetical protein
VPAVHVLLTWPLAARVIENASPVVFDFELTV